MIDFEAWEERERMDRAQRRAELAVTWPELILVVGLVAASAAIFG